MTIRLTQGQPVKGNDFYDRKEVINEIWNEIDQSSILLVAPRKFGKTSIMFHLRDNPEREFILYTAKAKHLQVMSLIGITAEHLLKIILLKRGYVINESISNLQFSEDFISKLKEYNEGLKTQEKLDGLYNAASRDLKIVFKEDLIRFDRCIKLFNDSNPPDYFNNIGTYVLNPHLDVYNKCNYLGYKEIKSNKCLKVIQDSRNSYLHKLEAKGEQNGVVWYLFNFLIWLSKKEYPDFFKDEKYIVSEDNKNLFRV